MRDTGKEDQKKKLKLDGGQVIRNKKNKKNLYPSNLTSFCPALLPPLLVSLMFHRFLLHR